MTTTPVHKTPTVLRCTSASDFLAALPVMMGVEVQDSLVIVLFQGSQARQAMRLDLPPPNIHLGEGALDERIAGVVKKLRSITGVALVIYTSESFSTNGEAPRIMLATWLKRSLESHGIEVRESCCIAADAWARYHSPEARAAGRPLEEINGSIVGLEARTHIDAPLSRIDELGSLPKPTRALRTAFSRAIAATTPPARQGLQRGEVAALLAACQRVFASRPPAVPPPAADVAQIAVLAADPVMWTLPLFSCVAGLEGEEPSEAHLTLVHDFVHTFPEGDIAAHLTAGISMLSSDRISSPRLREVAGTLAILAANVPAAYTAGLCALIAWLWWMAGLTTPANRSLQIADQHSPPHTVVEVMRSLVDAGPPQWVYRSEP